MPHFIKIVWTSILIDREFIENLICLLSETENVNKNLLFSLTFSNFPKLWCYKIQQVSVYIFFLTLLFCQNQRRWRDSYLFPICLLDFSRYSWGIRRNNCIKWLRWNALNFFETASIFHYYHYSLSKNL